VPAVEITRVSGASQVDKASKGWGPNEHPDEWKIVVRLSGEPNKAWLKAWEGVTSKLHQTAPELEAAWWEFKPTEQAIEIWTTDERVETLIRQLDEALDRANQESAEMTRRTEEFRAEQAQRREAETDEAARLQEKLDSL
jgi:hypothetical protein